jgi:hypothetical protein
VNRSDPILRFKSYRAYDETVASNVDKTIVLATEQEDYGGLEDARTLQMTAHSLPPLEAAAAKSPPEV